MRDSKANKVEAMAFNYKANIELLFITAVSHSYVRFECKPVEEKNYYFIAQVVKLTSRVPEL